MELLIPCYLLFHTLNFQFISVIFRFEFFVLKFELTIKSPKFFFVA